MNSKTKRTLRLTVFGLLSVILALLTILNIMLTVLKFTFYNQDFYVSAMASDKYVDSIYDDLLTSTEISCRIYTIPDDIAPELIDTSLISIDCQRYAYHIYSCFTGGELSIMSTKLDEESLAAVLLPLADSSEFIDKDNIYNVIIPALEEEYNNTINSLPVNKMTDMIPKFLASKTLKTLVSVYPMLLFVWFTVLCFMYLVRRGKAERRFYCIFAAGFIPSAMVFAFSLVIHGYDLAERLPLGYSPFKTFCDTLINTTFDKLMLYSGLIFAFFAVGLLATSALLAFRKQSRNDNKTEKIVDLD